MRKSQLSFSSDHGGPETISRPFLELAPTCAGDHWAAAVFSLFLAGTPSSYLA